MWNFLKSFIWGDSEIDLDIDLTHDQALDILRKAQTEEEQEFAAEEVEDETPGGYFCYRRTGRISGKENDNFIIDNIFEFKSDLQDLDVGSEVSFTVYSSDGKMRVSNVVIHDEWSFEPSKEKSSWCLRNIICKVDIREGRRVVVNPGNISVDLDVVASEFIPVVGDWLELEAKVEIEEQVTDLCGRVLEVQKIRPLRPQILEGCVRQWSNETKTGTINRSIFFNEDALSAGYVPKVGDRVITQAIESDQGRYKHRSLKIVLENQVDKKLIPSDTALPEYKYTLDGVSISKDIFITGKKLGETHHFEIQVANTSQNEIVLLSVTLSSNNNQCEIIKPVSLGGIKIAAGKNIKFEGLCKIKNMGETRELILFRFADDCIGRWITINLESKHENHYKKARTIDRRSGTLAKMPFKRNNKELIRGPKLSNSPHFVSCRLPEYPVPEKLLKIVNKYEGDTKINCLLEELQLAKRCLNLCLALDCYEDFFHTLLHLEEIQELTAIRSYAQDVACFITNGEYLMLEIQNLAEKRPSLMIGDRIIAKDAYNESATEYEGFVHKVGAKHVYIKFHQAFHDVYNGEDKSLIAVASRTTFRRMHQAISIAVRNLGNSFLFPDKVPIQKPQVIFTYEPYYDSIGTIHEKIENPKSECVDEENSKENNSIDTNSADNSAANVSASICKSVRTSEVINVAQESGVSGNMSGVDKKSDKIKETKYLHQEKLKIQDDSSVIEEENNEDMKNNGGSESDHFLSEDRHQELKSGKNETNQILPNDKDLSSLENICKSQLLLNEEFDHLSRQSNNKCFSNKKTNVETSEFTNSVELIKLEWYNKNLNYYQKEAVRNIIIGEARPLPYFIFGPPGTGKTVTLVETILQLLRLVPHSRLLVATPSNSAADLIATRLIDSGILKPGDLIRLVAYRCVFEDMLPIKLIPYSATADVGREGTHGHSFRVNEKGLTLGCNSSVIGRHRITIGTCSALGVLYTMGFARGHFTHIIVDEAGQAIEPEVMIPLALLDVASGQVVLAGDPLQLGPVISSKAAATYGLEETFLDRMLNRFPYVRDPAGFPKTGGYDPRLITRLVYNYRSLPDVLVLSSSMFYNHELIPTISEEGSDEAELLSKLRDILPQGKNSKPCAVVFHGVVGENYQTADCPSWFNPNEASQVFWYVLQLYHLGLKSTDIGIISPYIKQVRQIRNLLIEVDVDVPKVGTVEEFQGQEFNVILVSTVRSNESFVEHDLKHKLGFLFNPRRVNVAISRAQAVMIVVGNPHLLCNDPHWRNVINHCVETGGYRGCDLPSRL